MGISNFIAFGKESLSSFENKEWLVTNGLGSFASGTVAGLLTRRYHGLLVAALEPPLGRTLFATKFDEIAICNGKEYPLCANRWKSQTIAPQGYSYIEQFALEGTIPVWTFGFDGAILEKRIWMEPKAQTTYVLFYLQKGAIQLQCKAMVNYRGYHNTTHADSWRFAIHPVSHGCKVEAFKGATPYYVFSDRAKGAIKNEWYYDYFLCKENERGLDCTEDHLHAATFEVALKEKESVTFVLTTEIGVDLDGTKAIVRRKRYEESLVPRPLQPLWIQQLFLAADAFLVDRPPNGKTIIAGYHWFGDWGRDTMISLPGLTLITQRFSIAKTILQTFARYVNQGMIPNRFPDSNQLPEYNTADATLWYIEALRAYYEATKDLACIEELFPVLSSIIEWHEKGTRYQIHVDPHDGLLYAGENGLQLTWMDAKIGDWVVTARTGKPIEINALWYNALKTMAQFAQLLNLSSARFDQAAEKAKTGFQRFWNEESGYCYDVLDGPDGNDLTLRPNQIFSVSLPVSPLSLDQQRKIVAICGSELLTPRGLRSLSPKDVRYRGHYQGSSAERDGVYHQGTVWGWLLGPYAIAHFKVHRDASKALQILEPIASHLKEQGLGTCSEIFDGDEPFEARGCIAQAWTVAEVLRTWFQISSFVKS